MTRILLLALLLVTAEAAEPLSPWDARLPGLGLGAVKLTAESLPDAWQELNTRFAVRGVMVEDAALKADGPARIDLPDATLDQALDALLAAYPTYTRTQDALSGVIWVHPRARPLASLADDVIDVPTTEFAVPVGSGVFGPLKEAGTRVRLNARGMSAANSHDWPMDLPAGRIVLRDLCNRALIDAPDKAIFLTLLRTGDISVSLISTLAQAERLRPGARLWWNLGFAGEAPSAPVWEGVSKQLANPDPRLRAIARGYIAINSLDMLTDHWHRLADPTEALWTALALSRRTARLPDSSYTDVRDTLRRLLTADFLARGPAELVVVAACELTRFTRDPAPIETLATRADLAAADLAGVRDDLHRLARVSPTVRDTLARTGVAKQAFPDGVERLARPPRLVLHGLPRPSPGPSSTPPSAPPGEAAPTVTATPGAGAPWWTLLFALVAAVVVLAAVFLFRRRG